MKKIKIKIFKKFIKKKEISDLNEWILNQENLTLWNVGYLIAGYRFFDPNNKNWEKDEFGRILSPIKEIHPMFLNLRDKIKNILNFQDELISKNATSLISVIRKNGFIMTHKDSTIEKHVHMRANILLSNPRNGACIIIENKKYDIEKGSLIVFPANLLEHSTTIHNSDVPRTLISYPFLVPCDNNEV